MSNSEPSIRELSGIFPGQAAMDGDGVRMTRIIGTQELNILDPFLLLDNFVSDQAQDYIGGFPDHPHRGFETVTYLLAGRMRHKDNAGHEGVIEAGGVQWMTAGKGIVHSEMPEQENGLLHGFQLWVNLPASEKMQEPAYQEFNMTQIPVEQQGEDTVIRVIAGETNAGTRGAVKNTHVDPLYLDVTLGAGLKFEQSINTDYNAFVFVIEGTLQVGQNRNILSSRQLGVFANGDEVLLQCEEASRFLLVAGRPLKEPVARGGPFVMNTREEIVQAFEDFQNNRFQQN